MSRHSIFTVICIIIAAVNLGSCKKDSKNADGPDVFKNTIWTGEFNYTDKDAEPMSIAFGEDGTLSWHELTGDYSGTYKFENGQVSISIDGSPAFKASVSGDNSLSNIQSADMNGRTLSRAALNGSSDANIENTTWTAPNLSITFKPGSKLDLALGESTLYSDLSYVRKEKSIRFSALPAYKWFLVVNGSTSMKGANTYSPDPKVYGFSATKQ